MKIALLQIDPTVGDLAGNAKLIADAALDAAARGADLAVAPELSLVGYHVEIEPQLEAAPRQ